MSNTLQAIQGLEVTETCEDSKGMSWLGRLQQGLDIVAVSLYTWMMQEYVAIGECNNGIEYARVVVG